MSEVVRSAARVLDLIEYFAGLEGSASLATVVTTFGLPKSSAFGLLKTLCVRGYLVRNERGLYELNSYFRDHGFGWGGDHIARISALAEPVMKLLAEELDETLSLGILTREGELKVIKQALCKQPIRYEITVNQLLPAYCTAMGRVILSVLPAETRQRVMHQQKIVARTPVTVTDPARIEQIIEQAADDAYCVVADESDLGGTGVATCISIGPGRPAVAMNVACISARFPEKRDAVISALMREAVKLRELIDG